MMTNLRIGELKRTLPIVAGFALALAASAQTFTSSDGPITVAPSSSVYTPASRYPSQITVPGSVAGTVTNISITLHGLNADGNSGLGTQGLGMLLVSPDGRQLEIHRGTSDGNESLTNVTLSISDANALLAPNQNTPWPATTGTINIKPTAYADGASPTNYPAPGPGAPAHDAAPAGIDTLNGVFTGAVAAGTWKLYVVDRFAGDNVSFTSWDLILTVAAAQSSTSTALASTPNPSFTSGANSSVTLTATVTGTSGSPTGTVAFKDGANTLAGCSASSLAPSGANTSTATCATAFGTEGAHSLTAVYAGGGSFAASTSASLNQFVKNHSTNPTANQFCNTGPISGPGQANTMPYPSVINIGTDTPALTGSVSTLSLTLNGLAGVTGVGGLKAVLVGPGGSKSLVFLSDAGFSAGQNSVSVTFADNGSAQVPQNGVLVSGTYLPTAYDNPSIASPAAPAPQVPAMLSLAAPAGGTNAQSFTTAFNGGTANGDWSLFLFDSAGTTSSVSVSGGWCLNVTSANGAASQVALGSSLNPAITGNPVAITATVIDATSHAAITTGSVTFTENSVPVAGGPSGAVTLDANGKASFSTAFLPEGDHVIVATFSGNSTYNLSFSSMIQRLDRGTSGPINSGNTLIFCNPNAVTIPANSTSPLDTGAANPNPQNIFVSGIAGSVNTVSLTLNGFHHPLPNDLTTLLVGPQATNASALDFFSRAGGLAPFGPVSISFSDAAAAVVPQNAPPAASNKPTSYTAGHTYFASPSGFYTLPSGPYQYGAPAGFASFASAFSGTNPNGTWSLYFNQLSHETGGGVDGGWCLSLTLNTPVLSISKSHTGNFTQGQTGATYSITVTNNGPGATAGLVSVSDTVPSGLTATAISGTGWTCSQPAGPCTRNDALPAGSSYPVLTLTANVAANATSPVVNQATVSGGGDPASHTASDSTIITSSPDLTIAKTHSGNFRQGDASDNYSITVTNSGTGSTSGLVTVTDTLPSGLTATAISGTGWTCTLGTLTCTRSDVLAGLASYPAITLTVSVANNAPASVTNTATVSGGGEINTGNDTASDPTTIVQVADMMISKSHSGNFRQGDTGDAYTIIANNAGTGPTTGTVTVVDTLPAGLTATAISGTGWTCTLGTLTCTRSDALAASTSYPAISLTVNVANNAPASVTNSVAVSGGGELNTTNNTATDLTAIVQVADLAIAKSHSSAFMQGDIGRTYSITVSNVGPGPTTGTVSVTDTLPAGLTATAISGTGWTCTLGTLSCTRSDVLAASASYPVITLTVNVAINAPSSVTNTATVSGGGELNTANNTANDVTTVAAQQPTTTTVAAAAGQYSDSVTLTATVSPTASGTVTFTVDGNSAGSAATNGSGVASVPYTIQVAAGAHTIAAQFASSDPAFTNSAGSNTLTVTREDATVTPSSTNPFSVQVSTPGGNANSIVLTATVQEASDGSAGNISNAQPITCSLTPVVTASTLTATAAVTGGGVGGTLTATCTFTNVPVNVYAVSYTVGGDYYTGSATAALAVFDPSAGFTTGGGTITRNGVHANFSFNAKYKNNGTIDGSFLYIEHRSTGDVRVQGSTFSTLSVVDNTAVFILSASLNGTSGYTAQVNVTDNGDPGINQDTFGLQLTAPNGTQVTDLTFSPVTIDGGNIQTHN